MIGNRTRVTALLVTGVVIVLYGALASTASTQETDTVLCHDSGGPGQQTLAFAPDSAEAAARSAHGDQAGECSEPPGPVDEPATPSEPEADEQSADGTGDEPSGDEPSGDAEPPNDGEQGPTGDWGTGETTASRTTTISAARTSVSGRNHAPENPDPAPQFLPGNEGNNVCPDVEGLNDKINGSSGTINVAGGSLTFSPAGTGVATFTVNPAGNAFTGTIAVKAGSDQQADGGTNVFTFTNATGGTVWSPAHNNQGIPLAISHIEACGTSAPPDEPDNPPDEPENPPDDPDDRPDDGQDQIEETGTITDEGGDEGSKTPEISAVETTETASSGRTVLPFTGASAWVFALAGIALLGAGIALRRADRGSRQSL